MLCFGKVISKPHQIHSSHYSVTIDTLDASCGVNQWILFLFSLERFFSYFFSKEMSK